MAKMAGGRGGKETTRKAAKTLLSRVFGFAHFRYDNTKWRRATDTSTETQALTVNNGPYPGIFVVKKGSNPKRIHLYGLVATNRLMNRNRSSNTGDVSEKLTLYHKTK